jgi:L-fuculose-phosphate aldolase
VRLGDSSFLITPRRVDRSTVDVLQLALVEAGRAEAGSRPSRAARVHDAIYRAQPRVGAIVNSYPVNATALSVSGENVDTRTMPESFVVVRAPGLASFDAQSA